jgi:prephenate dehydrogenase
MGILFKQAAIIGVGVLGGSLAKAIRKKRLAKRVVGIFRTKSSADKAKKCGLGLKPVIGMDPKELEASDLIILAGPIHVILQNMNELKSLKLTSCLITDVGSTKVRIQKNANGFPRGVDFVGSHPMAGSSGSGPAFARADLFEGAIVYSVPSANSRANQRCARLWTALGAKVEWVSAARHDQICARVSHVPHAVSNALLATFRNQPWGKLAGPSLERMTRVAGANPEMWFDIYSTNKKPILAELRKFKKELARLEGAIRSPKMGRLLREFQAIRRIKLNPKNRKS